MAIGDDAGDEARCRKRQLAAVAITNVGAMDADREKPALGVGQDTALSLGNILARTVACATPVFRNDRYS